MTAETRIDRLSLMLTWAFIEVVLDALGDLDEPSMRRILVETFGKAKHEIETYERAIERQRIEPSNN